MHEIPVAVALLVAAAAAVAALAVRRCGFGVTSVTSTSMLPALRPGDRRLVLRSTLASLRRGDVVVAWSRELGTDVVKRVVGLPGDVVTIHHDGTVAIDGASLPEPYVAFAGGRAGRFHVPTGAVLLLGDNRVASSDSRHWRDPYLTETALRGRLVRRPSRCRAPSAGDAPRPSAPRP